MRRVILAIVLVIILALFGLPYWFGIQTEKAYNDIVNKYSETGSVSIVEKATRRAG
jgi:hypothetical protein